MRNRGLVLIIVIGILGVLAALAVAFVAMAQLERRASEQRVNAARAYLLARSGIEDALARLGMGQDPAYGGENWDGSPDGLLNAFEAGEEVYHRTGAGTAADVETCPVKHAMRPSFFARFSESSPDPVLVAVDGRKRGYSGKLAGDYAQDGNGYALKAGAEGSEGQGFYINGGDPSFISSPSATSDYNRNLRRMLGILARAIQEDVAAALGGSASSGNVGNALAQLTLTEADGWALIDARPSAGWKDWDQVRDLALEGSQAKLDVLKPYLTLHAWTDRKVVAPHVAPAILEPNGIWHNPYAGRSDKSEPAKAYHSWGEYKLDPARRETTTGLRAPDFERINGRIVGRAPIDLPWARVRRAALLALLGGLKGPYLDETFATAISYGDVFGFLKAAEVFLSPVPDPTDICHKVADQILTSTSELATWQQWHDFCDALPDAAVMSTEDYALFLTYSTAASAASPALAPDNPNQQMYAWGSAGFSPLTLSLWLKGQAVRDILKANFNPNSSLNKFGPNLSTWKLVDKSDLLIYSTEFSLLLPISHGHQEVESQGRVLDRRGRLLASRVLKTLLAAPPPLRLTTQKEFVSEDLGALDIAGDERGFRLPGQAVVPFITASRGSARTWGHALPGLAGSGASLQTYPEPVVDDGVFPAVTLSVNPADYDGAIQSATVETAQDHSGFYAATGATDSGTPYRKMMMLARYTGNFDLDVSAADPNGTAPRVSPFQITPRQNHPDFHQVTSNRTGEPGKAIVSSGNLLGAYTYQTARQRDTGSPKLEELRYSLLRAGDPAVGDFKLNTLYPDGCYSEVHRAPEYLDKGNADGFHGVVSLWIKANRLPPRASAFVYVNGRAHFILKRANFVEPKGYAASPNQFFGCAVSHHRSYPPLVFHFEIGHAKDDLGREHQFGVGRPLIPHRWELLTFRWDFRAPLSNGTGEMLLNAGRAGATPSERGTQTTYYQPANAPTMASDITVDHLIEALDPNDKSTWIYGPHCLSLGRGRPEWEGAAVGSEGHSGSGADATFDEFALYDFGGAGPGGAPPASAATQASPEVLAAARYPEGRYYKGSAYTGLSVMENDRAGEWFSAPIFLGGPMRLRGLAWTQIVPRELQGAPPSQGGVNGTGIGADLLGGASTGSPSAAISFELVDETGTAYATVLGENQLLTNPAFTPVNRSLRGAFRLHAVFQPNLDEATKLDTPILDPLTLDDVTIYYEPLGGPRVIRYEADGD